MGLPSFDASLPEGFSGNVRLFPLPNLVLFPNVVQALHIFEPRYCDMLEEALATDKLIALALLKPGWELKYLGKPPLANAICIGKILTHTPTSDDRHNILLAGVKRARLTEEIETNAPFRRAKVELLEDIYVPESSDDRSELRSELMEVLRHAFGEQPKESLTQLFSKQIPLGVLSDVIAFSSKLPIEVKQELLEQPRVECRCRILIQFFKQCQSKGTPNASKVAEVAKHFEHNPFPPPFSNN